MQNKSDIAQNPTQFAEKILQLIVDETEQSCKLLISCIEKAEANYGKPVESKFTGWFYGQFRLRGEEVDSKRKDLEHIPKSHQRVLDFQALIEKGEWHKNSSFNYYFFVELIKSIPGYKPLDQKRYPEMVNVLKVILKGRVEDYVADYNACEKASQKTSNELAALAKSSLDNTKQVSIANEPNKAVELALKNKQNTLFCLAKNGKDWYFSWIDNTGKEYHLELNQEAAILLSKVSDITELKRESHPLLKRACLKAKEAFLLSVDDKLKVLVNPQSAQVLSNELVMEKALDSTFVLFSNAKGRQLWWVNCFGKANLVPLDPVLNQWVDTVNTWGADEIIKLKLHLINVNTRHAVDKDEVKKVLNDHLLHLKPFTKKEPDVVPQPLNLSKFANIEKCLANKHDFKAKEKVTPGHLDKNNYLAVFSLFAKRPVENPELPEEKALNVTLL